MLQTVVLICTTKLSFVELSEKYNKISFLQTKKRNKNVKDVVLLKIYNTSSHSLQFHVFLFSWSAAI